MSRSSTREVAEGIGTSPGRETRRAQVEPTAALVALLAVCLGLSLYAVVLGGSLPWADRDLARPTLDRVHQVLDENGVVDPDPARALASGPRGYELNVTLRADERRWSAGPRPATNAEGASRSVSVRFGSTRVVPGRLRVAVWR